MGTIVEWLQDYPGDLCDPETTRLFKAIVKQTEDYMFMAHLTVELTMFEEALPIYEDLDTSWSVNRAGALSTSTSKKRQSILSSSELVIDGEVLYDLDSNLSRSDIGTPIKTHHDPSSVSLLVDDEASVVMARGMSGSDSRLPSTSDKKSGSGISTSSSPSGGSDSPVQWTAAVHWVMNNDPVQFAADLTRMQWELFRSIRVGLDRS